MRDLNEVLEEKRQALCQLEDEIEALETVAELLLDEKDRAFRDQARASYPMPTAADVRQQYEALGKAMREECAEQKADRGLENVLELNTADGITRVTKVTVKDEHLSDLRVLLDQSAKREEILLSLVEKVMQPNGTRPVITSSRPTAENKIGPIVPLESLSDQPSFDEGEDQRQVTSGEDAMKELLSIAAEHREAHANN